MTNRDYLGSPNATINAFFQRLNDEIATQLKLLLEQKHLYQKVSIDVQKIGKEVLGTKYFQHREWVEEEISKILRRQPLTVSSGSLTAVPVGGGDPETLPGLIVRNIRLFCSECGDRSVFNPVWYQDAYNQLSRIRQNENFETTGDIVSNQLFFIVFQCQGCKSVPEGFLIRKKDWQLSLDGRSPMEQIQLPTYIPKPEQLLYRDAIIASQSGKHLASVFYLRTFIEQFARRQTGITDRQLGDTIMDKYAATLPQAHRDHMPSFREWYDRLSEPIHSADEEAAEILFPTARGEVERHFDIRRVYKMTEKPTTPKK